MKKDMGGAAHALALADLLMQAGLPILLSLERDAPLWPIGQSPGRVCRASAPCFAGPDPEPDRVHGGQEDQRQHRAGERAADQRDRKSTRLNSSHQIISYAVFCLKKKKT